MKTPAEVLEEGLAAYQAALLRAAEETDYCLLCEQHPSTGHVAGCPLDVGSKDGARTDQASTASDQT